jgi:hypothetical protein
VPEDGVTKTETCSAFSWNKKTRLAFEGVCSEDVAEQANTILLHHVVRIVSIVFEK